LRRAFWFRKDLRLQDNKALTQCIELGLAEGQTKFKVFYWLRGKDFENFSGIRQHSIVESLRSLSLDTKNCLAVVTEERAIGIARWANSNYIDEVFATMAFDPEGVSEQRALETALDELGIRLNLIDSNYAITPGTVRKPDGEPYRVYTPFYKAWLQLEHEQPYRLPKGFEFEEADHSGANPRPSKESPFPVKAGEAFALETFRKFKLRALEQYSENRNRADLSGTSKLSFALAHGEIHPRTLLAELGESDGEVVFRKEIAWREFYADVLFHNPNTLDGYFDPKFEKMRYDSGIEAERKFERWKMGLTGFPMVDAGMRQLLKEGWMHNRVRMIVASFLVKDLHLEWQMGAKWFEENLADYDPASNSHGWQWTAGCGTDASPYFRVFNPVIQGYKFDPDGNYVRKYIPELSHLEGSSVHEPWLLVDGLASGYPEPMVDHSSERDEALARLEELKEITRAK
jgi:deoxyribodipyrimidine photo-lyase